MPPGPPVLSTLVAEIYGPDYNEQIKVAEQVKSILSSTEDVVDVDWMVENKQTEYKFIIDKEKAMLNGIVPQQIVRNLTYVLKEIPVSYLYDENSNNSVGIVMALNDQDKTNINDITSLKIKNQSGSTITVSDLVTVKKDSLKNTIYRKDQKRIVYVTADMAGSLEKIGRAHV